MVGVRRMKGAFLALGLAAALAGSAAGVYAQAPTAKKVYTSRTSFSLPVRIDDRDRGDLKELKLYVKVLPGDWVCRETAPPTQAKFAFQANRDGEYWFTFVTVDKSGRMSPSDLDREPTGLVVVVDTQPPEVDVGPLPVASGEVFLQCTLRDANPDYASVRMEYNDGRDWKSLEPLANTAGVFRVPNDNVLKGQVRVTAADKAKNEVVRVVDLGKTVDSRVATAQSVTVLPPATVTPPPAPPTLAVAPTAVTSVPAVAAPAATTPVPAPRVAEKIFLPDQGVGVARQLLNNTHCSMDYAIDTTGVAVTKVEAYATRDLGRTWQRVGEDHGRRGPVEFDLPEDGLYGIALVTSTANQPGGPPASGDTPDWWVEIDTVKPVVLLHGAHLGLGDEVGTLQLSWSARDKNLTADAVEIAYAPAPEGPWQVIAKGLKAEGQYRWSIPREAGARAYLRVDASDRAGNLGRYESREPVLLEPPRPKARVLGVSAGAKTGN